MKIEERTGMRRADQGRALRNSHFEKHPHSPHDLTAEDLHNIYQAAKAAEADGQIITAATSGYYIGFLNGYKARQLEERTERKAAAE